MSDARRRYRAIHAALTQLFGNPTGHQARHVQMLTAMICGIVGSTQSQMTNIAAHVPTMPGPKPKKKKKRKKKAKKKHKKRTKKVTVMKKASLVTRIERWYKNEHITEEQYFVPVVDALLTAMVDGN
jgi:hypothetical protein